VSDLRFAGRRAVVTGAASGIGRAVAVRLATEGASVVGLDCDEAGLRETFAGVAQGRGVVVDVADDDALDVLAAVLGGKEAAPEGTALAAPSRDSSLAPADVLVNAAGVLLRHDLLEHPLDAWQRTLDVNLRAPLRLSREFARHHVARGTHAAIVNVCSIESFVALPGHAAYTASKGALAMATRAFALELAPHGIRANAVAPGVTATAMNAALREDPQRAAELAQAIPLGRFAGAHEQAAGVCFLACEDASYITGAVLPIDGGWLTR
jgi:NAD(P)-dependent dehydrogenase (short-subunit alcohol dehydrogenase family)